MSFNYLQSYANMPVSAWCYIPTSLPQEQAAVHVELARPQNRQNRIYLTENGSNQRHVIFDGR